MSREKGPAPMQTILDALPTSGGCKNVAELAKASGVQQRLVSSACCRLKRRGLVERPKKDCYRLTRAGVEARDAGKRIASGPTGPHTGRRRAKPSAFRLKVWGALRLLRKATVAELLTAAGVEGDRLAVNNAQQFIRALRLAGYVAVTGQREPGTAPTSPGFARYLMLKDTGPQAPVYSAVKRTLYDPNTDASVPVGEGGR